MLSRSVFLEAILVFVYELVRFYSRCRVSLLYTNLSSILEKAFTKVIGL